MAEARKLYELRTRLGLTLEQAAMILGVHKSTLCRYEQEFPKKMSQDLFMRICRLYQVPASYFEEGKEEETVWFPLLSPEEVSAAYAKLPERDRLRISQLLTKAINR